MKNLKQLEQEAKESREDLCVNLSSYLPLSSREAGVIADKIILASVAMVTYLFVLAAQETEPAKEIQADEWIKWDGDSSIPDDVSVDVKLQNGGIIKWEVGKKRYISVGKNHEIVAYRIVK